MEESLILSKFDTLVKSGLVQYDDKQEIIEHIDGDLKFHFLLTSALAKKPTIQTPQSNTNESSGMHHGRRDGSDISTRDFEIGNIGNTHFLIANKFCFARPHLLLLTTDGYQRQYEPLRENDFVAARSVLTTMERNYVIFYNCGQDGGCSRLHKHLQLIPKPENSFAAFLDSDGGKEPCIPFYWFYRRFESQNCTPDFLAKTYADLLKRATEVGKGHSEHFDNAPPGAVCPHNMILTKRWMLVLPRQRGAVTKGAGVNALGMLGIIAVATKDEINAWLRQGLTEGLRKVGVSQKM